MSGIIIVAIIILIVILLTIGFFFIFPNIFINLLLHTSGDYYKKPIKNGILQCPPPGKPQYTKLNIDKRKCEKP